VVLSQGPNAQIDLAHLVEQKTPLFWKCDNSSGLGVEVFKLANMVEFQRETQTTSRTITIQFYDKKRIQIRGTAAVNAATRYANDSQAASTQQWSLATTGPVKVYIRHFEDLNCFRFSPAAAGNLVSLLYAMTVNVWRANVGVGYLS
jgi:hypothetical protein